MPSAAPAKTPLTIRDIATGSAEMGLEHVAGGGPLITLQTLVWTLPGLATETRLFYRPLGQIWVSDANGAIYLGPGAGLATDTFFSMLALETWQRTCRLDGLFLALRGQGQIEVQVFQERLGRSKERLFSEVVNLDGGAEVALDLSGHLARNLGGGLWFEIRNCSAADLAALGGARYVTRGGAQTAPRNLALCLADVAQDPASESLAEWAQAAGGSVLRFQRDVPVQGQLSDARAKGFDQAILVGPGSQLAPEVLNRLAAWLSLARDPSMAVTAVMLNPADRHLVATAEAEVAGEARPRFQGADLRRRSEVVAMQAGPEAPEALALTAPGGLLAMNLALADQPETPGFRAIQIAGVAVSRQDLTAVATQDLVTLQNVIFPETGLCTETDMYFHADGIASYRETSGVLSLEKGAAATFDTYFNALNIGKWHGNCRLNGLVLGLLGWGRVRVKVFQAIPDRSWEVLWDDNHTLSPLSETWIDLGRYEQIGTSGVIYFEIHAISAGVQLTGARYATRGVIDGSVRLCLSITTFKREAEVENTARRMAAWFKTADYADHMHLNVVDNGDSARIDNSDKITRFPNANLGGAGGFTRGLIEGEAAGFTHVLFMDDDASIPMEALHRAYVFLALSKDPKAAVAGAMISNSDKWKMWENGAVFDRNCKPLFSGVDLRDARQVIEMEFRSGAARSARMYGGWWFFAFPVAEVKRYPFPFFVRGDDINFSLANDFHITTVNGVVSFAEDFSDKESPMTLYLDLRNHLVQHLTLEKMEIGPMNLARIGVGFFLRNVVKFQYETCEALLMAWSDVLKGPEFFAENADAAGQRAAVKAIYRQEAWKPVETFDLTERRRYWAGDLGLKRTLFRLTINGHLLPFYKLWANRVVIQPRDRSNFRPVWGGAQLTYLNSTREKAYMVRQSKRRFLSLSLRLTWLILRTQFGYRSLLARYRKGYGEIAVPGFWKKVLKLGIAGE